MASKLVDFAGPWAGLTTVCEYLGITEQQLEQLVEQRQVLGILFRDHRRYFPTRQFHQGQVLEGLPAVLEVLAVGPANEQTWATWLAAPIDGEITGWDLLRAGQLDMLLTEARHDVWRWNQ
jgi:hypothetical protein